MSPRWLECADAQNLRMTTVNIMAAGIIIFGVVYNSAGLSLAQRARELASRRLWGVRISTCRISCWASWAF